MQLQPKNQPYPDVVPLRSAVLCVDCESLTVSTLEKCPVCGSRSVFNVAPILGGSILPADESYSARDANRIRFDLEINIALTQIDAKDVNAAVEGITDLLQLRLGGNRASLHVKVEPIANFRSEIHIKAA